MIGILFHGPEVFDSGWAARIVRTIKALGPVRCMLAGTMARTALLDSGLKGIESPGDGPSACLKKLAIHVDRIVLATHGKTRRSGLVFGGMVARNAALDVPVVQAECADPCFVEWTEGTGRDIIRALQRSGFKPARKPLIEASVWEKGGAIHRRMTTAEPGDCLLLDGILVGWASAREVVFVAKGRRLVRIEGAEVKAHGFEKLERLGGVDLRTAKLASARRLRRRGVVPRVQARKGRGVVFIDHAGMQVYELVQGARGAVTVGDDTTSVVGDILARFRMPVLGIVDGDGDNLLSHARMPAGSCVLTVKSDDRTGLKVLAEVFNGRRRVGLPFEKVRDRVLALVGIDLLSRRDY